MYCQSYIPQNLHSGFEWKFCGASVGKATKTLGKRTLHKGQFNTDTANMFSGTMPETVGKEWEKCTKIS